MTKAKLMDGNELAAQFIRDSHWNALPDAVQHKVKMCLVDIIAASVGGVLTPISDIAAGYAPVAWPGDNATILLHDRRATATALSSAHQHELRSRPAIDQPEA